MKVSHIVSIAFLAACMATGSAMQHATPAPAPEPPFNDIVGQPHADIWAANSARIRVKAANVERHKTLTREAAQLLQAAAELQAKVRQDDSEVARQEMLRQVDTIEKLAHNVKERMKGSR